MHDADLAHERDYVAGLYARLDELRAEKRAQLAQVRRAGAVGTMQNVPSGTRSLHCTRTASPSSTPSTTAWCSAGWTWTPGEAQYIGRIGLTTEDLQRLMVDWRAPEAGHFYQATAFDRQGVRRRRHLILQGREVKAIEDDVLDAGMLADRTTRSRAKAPCWPPSTPSDRPHVRHRGDHPVRAGPDHPFAPSRVRWWSRAVPEPARPP